MRVNCTRMEPAAASASGIGDLAPGAPAPHGHAGGPPQLDEGVDRTHQVELAPHRHEPAQREVAETTALDLADVGAGPAAPRGIGSILINGTCSAGIVSGRVRVFMRSLHQSFHVRRREILRHAPKPSPLPYQAQAPSESTLGKCFSHSRGRTGRPDSKGLLIIATPVKLHVPRVDTSTEPSEPLTFGCARHSLGQRRPMMPIPRRPE
jgi:hypothetical protein